MLLKAINILTTLLATAWLITAVVFLKTDMGGNVVQSVPDWTLLSAIALAVVIMLVSLLGLAAALTQRKLLLGLFVFLVAVTMVGQMMISIFLGLYVHDKDSIPGLNDLVASGQEKLELELVDFAEEQPVDWVNTQNSFKCCGISYELTYLYEDYNKTLASFLDSQISGTDKDCSSYHTTIEVLHTTFPSYDDSTDDDAEAAAAAALPADFFCKSKIKTLATEYTLYLGIASGFLIFLQFICFFCAIMVYVSPHRGDDDDDVYQVSPGAPLVESSSGPQYSDRRRSVDV
ncbi:Hypothetical Protein FCC1311_023422 [Hondaea fermentalgiana]|uniref:Uncharacterized protein n=1 Tax=Hondaea fermentalgiana TaxID=2315210 RepID=A0A2R5G514_9STRA|nr:Hypothetical Protein FCC1311_023422 [Hondaea fermentalgiana]|eukprot:GBG26122.1 Hypothetical Protein FCC1311_023422 [Hondaea fermentalgiana]